MGEILDATAGMFNHVARQIDDHRLVATIGYQSPWTARCSCGVEVLFTIEGHGAVAIDEHRKSLERTVAPDAMHRRLPEIRADLAARLETKDGTA